MLNLFHALVLSLTLSWVPTDSTHTGFRLRYGPGFGFFPNTIEAGNVTTITRDFTLTDTQQLCFIVVAFNGTGNSLPSDELCIRRTKDTAGNFQKSEITRLSCTRQ